MSDPTDQKICVMYGVRELVENDPVELWRDGNTDRLYIVAFNEGGYNSTLVDLLDVVDWLGTEHARNILATERHRQAVTKKTVDHAGGVKSSEHEELTEHMKDHHKSITQLLLRISERLDDVVDKDGRGDWGGDLERDGNKAYRDTLTKIADVIREECEAGETDERT